MMEAFCSSCTDNIDGWGLIVHRQEGLASKVAWQSFRHFVIFVLGVSQYFFWQLAVIDLWDKLLAVIKPRWNDCLFHLLLRTYVTRIAPINRSVALTNVPMCVLWVTSELRTFSPVQSVWYHVLRHRSSERFCRCHTRSNSIRRKGPIQSTSLF